MWTSDITVSIGSPSFSNQNEISSTLSLRISLFFPNINLNCLIRIAGQRTLYHFEPHKGGQYHQNLSGAFVRAAILLIYRTALDTFQILDIFSGKTELYVHEFSMTYCLLSLSRIGRLSSIQSSCYVHKGRKISCAALTNRELIMLRDIFTQDGQ